MHAQDNNAFPADGDSIGIGIIGIVHGNFDSVSIRPCIDLRLVFLGRRVYNLFRVWIELLCGWSVVAELRSVPLSFTWNMRNTAICTSIRLPHDFD